MLNSSKVSEVKVFCGSIKLTMIILKYTMYAQCVWLFKKILELFGCYSPDEPVIVKVDFDGDGETDIEFTIN